MSNEHATQQDDEGNRESLLTQNSIPSQNDHDQESPSLPSKVQDYVILPHDPGKRMLISSYPVNDRDNVRRRYIDQKPCRLRLSKDKLPQTLIGKKDCRFIIDWYDLYDWLEYSVQNDAAFCFYCFLLKDDTKGPKDDVFVNGGWRRWHEPSRLKTHVGEVGSAHNEAREKYNFFINQNTSIIQRFEKISSDTKSLYNARLTYSLKCLTFLLRQGLAFRGHNESENSTNTGNFLELLKWLAGNNENVAKVVLSNAPKNHQVTSPTIQKDLIECCAKETTRLIIGDIDGDYFGILADESSDISHKEQLALCVHYVDKGIQVCERFLGILHVGDTTSLTLMAAIESLLGEHSLLMSNIHGHCYDGASNMRGEINGLKNLVMRNTPSAYFVHCFAHQLQLTLVAVAKDNCDCASFFQQLGFVLNVIGVCCKRLEMIRVIQAENVMEALEMNEIESGRGLNQELGLSRPGDTRWGSHYKSMLNLIALYPMIIDVLMKVGEDAKSRDDRVKAQNALDNLESFEFVSLLYLIKVIFGYINELCEALQRRDQDIVNAMTFVSLTKEHLQNTRDHGWDDFLHKVSLFCAKHNIEVPPMNDSYAPRGRSRPFFAKVTNLHQFRIEIFLSVIDMQLQELNNLFDESNMELLLCMA